MKGYDSLLAGVAMFVLRRLPAFLSLLMLGALALRLGLPFLLVVPLTLALLVALFLPKAAVQMALSAVLGGGSLAWLWVAWMRVSLRLDYGQPWVRLAIILGAVALFTGWSAWVLRPEQTKTKSSRPFSA